MHFLSVHIVNVTVDLILPYRLIVQKLKDADYLPLASRSESRPAPVKPDNCLKLSNNKVDPWHFVDNFDVQSWGEKRAEVCGRGGGTSGGASGGAGGAGGVVGVKTSSCAP